MCKKLSEEQVILLREKLDVIGKKYDIVSVDFYDLIGSDYSELAEYDFSDETVDIDMEAEDEYLEYSVDDMLRYLSNIEEIKFDNTSAWCKNIKQIIININKWEAEKINITKYSFSSNQLTISFVENPFLIGIAAIDKGIIDESCGITPCSQYIAAELEYSIDNYLSKDEECKILSQLLHTISVDTGFSLKIDKFFSFDNNNFEEESDDVRKMRVCYRQEDLLAYTKAMDYFSKAIEIEDVEIKYLHFYKIIEYFSPIASKKSAYSMLNNRLDALRVKNRDQKYLESIFQLTRDYDTSLKDKELATTVLHECADSLELFDVLPKSIQQQIKKRLHLQKDVITLNPTEKDGLDKEIGQILYSTRNKIVHAKSNYRPTGYECNMTDMEQLNIFMKKLCQCLIIWNNRQPTEYRLD